jgi:hypothetical protein
LVFEDTPAATIFRLVFRKIKIDFGRPRFGMSPHTPAYRISFCQLPLSKMASPVEDKQPYVAPVEEDSESEEEEHITMCDCCKESFPWEGWGQGVIMGYCEAEGCEHKHSEHDYEHLCGYCSTYNEEEGGQVCIDCDKKLNPKAYESEDEDDATRKTCTSCKEPKSCGNYDDDGHYICQDCDSESEDEEASTVTVECTEANCPEEFHRIKKDEEAK